MFNITGHFSSNPNKGHNDYKYHGRALLPTRKRYLWSLKRRRLLSGNYLCTLKTHSAYFIGDCYESQFWNQVFFSSNHSFWYQVQQYTLTAFAGDIVSVCSFVPANVSEARAIDMRSYYFVHYFNDKINSGCPYFIKQKKVSKQATGGTFKKSATKNEKCWYF